MIKITLELTSEEARALLRIVKWLDSAILARIFRPRQWRHFSYGPQVVSHEVGTVALRKVESGLAKEGIT